MACPRLMQTISDTVLGTKLHLFPLRGRKPRPMSRTRRATVRGRSTAEIGFTLVELMLTLLIMGILFQLGVTLYNNYRERTDIAKASTDIAAMGVEILQYANDHKGLPDTLADIGRATTNDPWGNAYQYLNHQSLKGNGNVRKDKNIVPINSDFDLYSSGKDGQTQDTLTAGVSRDDIVRANNGRFVGLASDYDP